MKKAVYLIGLFLLISFLSGCKKDDEYVYPPVITEILCACTDSSGSVSHLQTDKGKSYRAVNGNAVKGLSKDSVYRVYCVYELSAEMSETATLYSFQPLLSPNPIKAGLFFNGIKTDPVKPVSVWKSGDYINLSLDVMSQDLGKHRFHFVDNGIITVSEHKALELILYHDKGNDAEAYFQRLYLSVPLKNYSNLLFPGDFIIFRINTFNGLKVYSLTF